MRASRLAAMAVDAEAATASANAAADAAVASSLTGPKLVKRAGGRSTRVNPEIVIHTDQRKGRKQVTIVMGLDLFDIKLADAARACKKAFASGATVAKVCTGGPPVARPERAVGRGEGGRNGRGTRGGAGRGTGARMGRGNGSGKELRNWRGKGRKKGERTGMWWGSVFAKSRHGWLLAVTGDFHVRWQRLHANWVPPTECMHRRLS